MKITLTLVFQTKLTSLSGAVSAASIWSSNEEITGLGKWNI